MKRSLLFWSLAAIFASASLFAGFDRIPEASGAGIWGGCGDVTLNDPQTCELLATCHTVIWFPPYCEGHCFTCPPETYFTTAVGTANLSVINEECPIGAERICVKYSGQFSCHCQQVPSEFECGTFTQHTASGTCPGG